MPRTRGRHRSGWRGPASSCHRTRRNSESRARPTKRELNGRGRRGRPDLASEHWGRRVLERASPDACRGLRFPCVELQHSQCRLPTPRAVPSGWVTRQRPAPRAVTRHAFGRSNEWGRDAGIGAVSSAPRAALRSGPIRLPRNGTCCLTPPVPSKLSRPLIAARASVVGFSRLYRSATAADPSAAANRGEHPGSGRR